MKYEWDEAKNRSNFAEPGWVLRTRFLPWLLVALVIVFVGVIRLRLLQIPLERDEGEYAYAGWWRAYRAGHYTRVGVADIISYDRTEYRWGDVESYGPPSPLAVFVYKRI